MEGLLEQVRKKYRMVKSGESSIDLLSLKSEVESLIKKLQDNNGKNKKVIAEAEDILIDVTKIIEESHCQPFRPKRV